MGGATGDGKNNFIKRFSLIAGAGLGNPELLGLGFF